MTTAEWRPLALPALIVTLGLLPLALIWGIEQDREHALEHDEVVLERFEELSTALLHEPDRLPGARLGLASLLGEDSGLDSELLASALRELPPTTASLEQRRSALDRLRKAAEEHRRAHQESYHRRRDMALGIWVVLLALAAGGAWGLARRRAAAAEALAEHERRLFEIQKMDALGRVAGGLAHDLNNILAAIRAHAELARKQSVPGDPVASRMDEILGGVLRASSLVERLLAFGRKQPSHREVLRPNELIEELVKVLGASFSSGVELELALADDLWPIEIDPVHLEQILTNLLVNAAEAMPRGGEIRVSTRNRPPSEGSKEDRIAIAVRDDGVGIAPAVRDRMFEPFFSTKTGSGRNGLGLSTVYGLVRRGGGTIEVDSEPGEGTELRVLFPRSLARPGASAMEDDYLQGTEHLLLVEDEAELREAMVEILLDLGYRVTPAAGVTEAIAEVDASPEPVELVLSDVRLTDGTGPELVEHLRARCPELKALYLSGYTDRVALRSATERREAFFLKKPFSARGLARMVRELLDAELLEEVDRESPRERPRG